jgi:hypothetical protein
MSRNNSINLPIINNSSNSAPFARSNSLNITHSNESVRSSRAESPASSQHGSLHKINELKLENERLKKNLAHAEEAIMSYQSYLKGGNSSRFVNGLNRKEVIPLQIESEVFDQENQTTTSIPSSVNISNNANMKKSFISTQTSGKYQECNFLCNKIEKLEKSLTEKSNELSTMEIELRKIISIKDNEINDLRHQNNQLRNHSNINLKNDSIWKTHLINIQQLLYQEKINIRHEKDMIKQQLKSFQSSFYMIQQQYQIKSNVSNELNCEFKELQNEIIQLKNEKKSLCDFHTLHYDQLIKNNKDLQSQIILLEEQRKQYELDKIEYQNDIQRLQHEISSFNNHHHHIHEPKNPWNFSTENFTAENFSEVIEEIVDNLNKLQLSFKNELKSVEGLAHVKDLTRISSIQELTLEKDKLVCDFDHQRYDSLQDITLHINIKVFLLQFLRLVIFY